jgi:uncharacterized protein (DUF433 family)
MQAQTIPDSQTRPRRSRRKDQSAYEQHITQTPGVRGGKPRIVGRRITVSDVAFWYLQQVRTADEIVREYDLTHAQVHAALAFYYDHRAEIDARETQDTAAAERLMLDYPAKVQANLVGHG